MKSERIGCNKNDTCVFFLVFLALRHTFVVCVSRCRERVCVCVCLLFMSAKFSLSVRDDVYISLSDECQDLFRLT